ncbi:MAG TPA: FG-GAP-like repeat-containing protein [Terriglobales bacterium]|nr:FG-GAP-like repeat-containing protein [Terriglobales bacterium]
MPVLFSARIDTLLPGVPGSCAAAVDFNGDGNLDIVTCSAGIWVLLGDGDGTFQQAASYADSTSTFIFSVFVADFNGDGKPDILAVNQDNTVSVYLNNGNGTFQPEILSHVAWNSRIVVTVGDFNGDGKADLVVPVAVPQVGNSALVILLGNGDGTFQSPILSTSYATTPAYLQVADFNHDGKFDVLWVGDTGASVFVFLGNGDGTVQQPLNPINLPGAMESVAVADFNNDGISDIAIATNMSSGEVFLGNGDGTFGAGLPFPGAGAQLLVDDFNGDGKLDLITGGVAVFLGNGDGTFQQAVTSSVPSANYFAVGDFNGDGKSDVVFIGVQDILTGQAPALVSVALGKGDGTLIVDDDLFVSCNCLDATLNREALIADLNGDGTGDLIYMQDFPGYGTLIGSVLVNRNGMFQSPQVTWAKSSNGGARGAIGDLNHDGKPDLVVTADYVGVLLGNGDGTYQAPVYYGSGKSVYVALGDFNGDGNLDIVTADTSSISLSSGNGDGTFGFPTSISSLATFLVVADFNKDGKLDLATNDAVLLGNGDGTFQSPISTPVGGIAAVGDFNNDGILDFVALNGSNQVSIMFGNGDGRFQSPENFVIGGTASSVAVSDFNKDGKLDIAVLNSGLGDVVILLGNGDGTFSPPRYFGESWGFGPIVAGDLNGDGFPDIVVAGTAILFNRPPGADPLLSTNAVRFGNQAVGSQSGPQAVTLSNSGQAPLSLGSVTVTGPQAGDFSQSNNCGSDVPPGFSCSIQVTFTPQAAGLRSAMLQIVDSASSLQTIAISGTGASMGLAIAPGSSRTVSVPAGQTAQYTLTVGGGGISGVAMLSCTGAPEGAACSIPGGMSISMSGTQVSQFNVNITTASPNALATLPRRRYKPLPWPWFLGVVGFVFLPSLFNRKKRFTKVRLRSLPLLLSLFLCACGGSGGTQSNPNATPPGTYQISVTATSGSTSQSLLLTLTVR